VKLPDSEDVRIVRIPRDIEWAYFKVCPDAVLGEHKWVAGFQEEIWRDHKRAPNPGQRVDVIWIKDLLKDSPKSIRRAKRVRQIEQLAFSRPIDERSTNHREWTGGTNVPLEIIQNKVSQPLPRAGERLELAECKPFPVQSLIFGHIKPMELEITKCKEEKDFEPNLVRREMVKKINDPLTLSLKNLTWKMIQAWPRICAEYPVTMKQFHINQFWSLLRDRQTLEWNLSIQMIKGRRNQGLDRQLVMLTIFNQEITHEEYKRRMGYFSRETEDQAVKILQDAQLRQVKWNPYIWLPEESRKELKERLEKGREMLKDFPQEHREWAKRKSQEWFEGAKRQWLELRQEAIQADIEADQRFRILLYLKIRAHKNQQRVTNLQQMIARLNREYCQLIQAWYRKEKICDSRVGHREMTEEELGERKEEILRELGPLQQELKMLQANSTYFKKKIKMREQATELIKKYFADLKACGRRILQVQLLEYRRLCLDTSSFVDTRPETK
jgi:hypothetical protein